MSHFWKLCFQKWDIYLWLDQNWACQSFSGPVGAVPPLEALCLRLCLACYSAPVGAVPLLEALWPVPLLVMFHFWKLYA